MAEPLGDKNNAGWSLLWGLFARVTASLIFFKRNGNFCQSNKEMTALSEVVITPTPILPFSLLTGLPVAGDSIQGFGCSLYYSTRINSVLYRWFSLPVRGRLGGYELQLPLPHGLLQAFEVSWWTPYGDALESTALAGGSPRPSRP